MKTAYDIILEPVLTEKAEIIQDHGKFTFKVATDATKHQIKRAVEKIFKVDVVKVNVINCKGKTRRRGFRYTYKEPDFKKAMVTLKKGQTIELFEGI